MRSSILGGIVAGVVDRFLGVLSRPRCAACDALLGRDAVFCARCVSTLEPPPPTPSGVTASFAFGGAIAEAIRRFKYAPRPDLARPLGRAIVQGLPDARTIDVVAPIPLHPLRLRERGFDQAALLARSVATALDRPIAYEILTRVVHTPQLAALGAERRRAIVEGAFVADPRKCGPNVLLVDDVMTTGATISAATRAVVSAGGAASAHVLAATPRE